MVVLDGTGAVRECRMRTRRCPDLRVRLNVSQRAEEPLTEAFLVAFDRWVDDARSAGTPVLVRCQSGWHRTGRLAAYYEMKYRGSSLEEAQTRMNEVGRFMWRHRELGPQVEALWDYIQGRPCSVAQEFCVEVSADVADEDFAMDVCPPVGGE